MRKLVFFMMTRRWDVDPAGIDWHHTDEADTLLFGRSDVAATLAAPA